MSESSTPSLSEFDPDIIPYQRKVIRLIKKEYDYSGGTLEILLSGSVGCLREDALVETVDGAKPICDITPQDYLLSFSHKSDQFVYQSSSGAYLKDKGYLYRVIHEHGEFVASGNHLCATSHHNYLRVQDLSSQHALLAPSFGHHQTDPLAGRLLSLSSVLDCWQTVASFFHHCAKHIRQCDPQLLSALNACLSFFPLQADAQEYGQFFYRNTHEHRDDYQVQALARDRNVESLYLPSMRDCLSLLEKQTLVGEAQGVASISYVHILLGNLPQLQCQMHTCHPKALLSFLCRICVLLNRLLYRKTKASITNSSILAIEKLGEGWYWDLQVPNTNNYVANGAVHHNSAKSILAAHLGLLHCLEHKNARLLLGRKAMPDLKDTIFQKILEHLEGTLEEKKHYWVNHQRASIKFINGSEIISRSWADRKYKKMRSLELSAAIIEELTENDDKDKQAYDEIKMRVARLPHLSHVESWILNCTNPDSPSHWAWEYFIRDDGRHPNRRVFYSVTTDNPFLPESYIRQLKEDLDPKLAQRMIYGKWIELTTEVIYHQYDSQLNYRDTSYDIDRRFPVLLSFDFNIGAGKPLSAVLGQYIDDTFHWFAEVVVEGLRTEDALEELESRGLLDLGVKYEVYGDATGKRRDTRSKRSDWDIIQRYLANYKSPKTSRLAFELRVGITNPRIRDRHNTVNAYCNNAEGRRRFFVYKDCPVAHKGMRLTKLKPGSHLIEDDSPEYQHITTAIGYAVCGAVRDKTKKKQGTVRL